MSVFVSLPNVLITVALYYCLKSGRTMPPALFFFLRIALAILGLLWSYINFRVFLVLCKMMGNLTGLALNM